MEELIKRLGALAFAAVYAHKHGSERASALRVARSAYRFLDGEDVDTINREADAANAVREEQTRRPAKTPSRVVVMKKQLKKLRRLTPWAKHP